MKTGLDLMNELQRAVAAVPPDEINECSWNEQKGVLISGRDAQSIIGFLKNRNKVLTDFAAQSVREDRESRWISVKDRLPKKDELVLCFYDGIIIAHVQIVYTDGYAVFKEPSSGMYNIPVTHWQPLPSPPINQ